MSVLDQLFNSEETHPESQPVKVEQLDSEDWTVASTALAGHQLMQDGYKTAGNTSGKIETPPYGKNGEVDVAKSLATARDYETLLLSDILNDQTEDLRTHAIADDVFDGGIKEGSRVLIRIIRDAQLEDKSWHELAKEKVTQQGGTLREVVFDKFSVNSITEPDQERYQILQTFGADLVYFFGRRPRMMRMIGRVLNGKMFVNVGNSVKSMDWKNALQRQYNRFLRGTKTLQAGNARIMIHAQDTVYVGYLLNMQSFVNAASQGVGQVTLTFLIAERNFPQTNDDNIPGWEGEDGYKISDKTVPEEMFPESSIKFYFEESERFVKQIAVLEEEVDELAEKAAKADGFDDKAAILSSLEDKDFESMASVYFYPSQEIKLHKLYDIEGTSTPGQIAELDELRADPTVQKLKSHVNASSQEEAYDSQVRNKEAMLETKAGEMNKIARDLVGKYQTKSRLSDLRDQVDEMGAELDKRRIDRGKIERNAIETDSTKVLPDASQSTGVA